MIAHESSDASFWPSTTGSHPRAVVYAICTPLVHIPEIPPPPSPSAFSVMKPAVSLVSISRVSVFIYIYLNWSLFGVISEWRKSVPKIFWFSLSELTSPWGPWGQSFNFQFSSSGFHCSWGPHSIPGKAFAWTPHSRWHLLPKCTSPISLGSFLHHWVVESSVAVRMDFWTWVTGAFWLKPGKCKRRYMRPPSIVIRIIFNFHEINNRTGHGMDHLLVGFTVS